MIAPTEWPHGIDVHGRFEHWKVRQSVPIVRNAIERLAAESASVELYDVAVAAYAKQFALSGPWHPGRRALDRLARRYVRHYRRELVRRHQLVEAAARCALIGAAG
jgi:hypothetical protein